MDGAVGQSVDGCLPKRRRREGINQERETALEECQEKEKRSEVK